ncbi:MAG: hypothetical protein WCJ61_08980 [Paludibacter sp.]
MKISCVVIDANQQSVCVLSDCIKLYENQVNLVAKFDKPLLAFDFIKEHKIDFVFVASEFKDSLGSQTVSKLANKPLFIITDTDSEAGSYFSNNANYILNPIEYAGFFQAITSLRQSISTIK